MKRPSRTPRAVPTVQIGPNWKLIRNLFIIAGLLIAISIMWDIYHETRTRRETENRQRITRQNNAREEAEARTLVIPEARKHDAEPATPITRVAPVIPPEPHPPVEAAAGTMNHSASKDPLETPVVPIKPQIPPEVVALKSKARELIIAAASKRDEQLSGNVSKMSWDLDLYLRTLPKSQQAQWLPHVDRIKNSIENNRVPDPISPSNGLEMSPPMEEITNYAVGKQKQIDQGFLAAAGKIHSAYLRKIGEAAEQAQAAGDKALAVSLKNMIANAANPETWIRSFGDNGADQSAPL